MRRVVFIILLFHLSVGAAAQSDGNRIFMISNYVRLIDTLAVHDIYENIIGHGIAEGTITRETMQQGINQLDSLVERKFGGFSRRSLFTKDGEKLLRLTYHDNIDDNLYVTFYFLGDEPAYSKLFYIDGAGERYFLQEEYYWKSKIYSFNTSGSLKSGGQKEVANSSLLDWAKKEFEDFSLVHNSH